MKNAFTLFFFWLTGVVTMIHCVHFAPPENWTAAVPVHAYFFDAVLTLLFGGIILKSMKSKSET